MWTNEIYIHSRLEGGGGGEDGQPKSLLPASHNPPLMQAVPSHLMQGLPLKIVQDDIHPLRLITLYSTQNAFSA